MRRALVVLLLLADPVCAQPLTYTIAKEETLDVPAKAEAVYHIVVQGKPTRASLEELLNRVYRELASRKSTFHGKLTHVAVFAYETEAHATAGMAQWLGMIIRIGASGPVKLEIRDDRLAGLGALTEVRFGLSEEQRKAVWTEQVQASNRAIREAMAKYPDPPAGASRDEVRMALRRQSEYRRSLVKAADAAITKRYKLSADQLLKISVEAHEKNWPSPK